MTDSGYLPTACSVPGHILWFPCAFSHPSSNVLMALQFLWIPGLPVCLGMCENCPSQSRKRKCIIPPVWSHQVSKLEKASSIHFSWRAILPSEFAKMCWLSQPSRILVAGVLPKLCHAGEGRRPSLKSASQPPEQLVVSPPLLCQCSSYIWLFSDIVRALALLGHQPTWHQGPNQEFRWYKDHESKMNQQMFIPPSNGH